MEEGIPQQRPVMKQRTLTSFLGGKAPEAPSEDRWHEYDSMLVYDAIDKSSLGQEPIFVAAFDLDDTLITTSSKRRFAKDADDWKFLLAEVPRRLGQLAQEQYFVVIFTNQLGVGLDRTGKRLPEFKKKVEAVFSKVKTPMLLIAALDEDFCRKPCTGMWDFTLSKYLKSHSVDVNKSFFVGDAAGRPAGWKQGRRGDHASTDRKFALNIGLKFLTPEEFFLGEPEVAYLSEGFDPKKIIAGSISIDEVVISLSTNEQQEAVIFVGSPASGKTTFYERHFRPLHYVHINQDTLKTQSKCKAAIIEAIEAGRSVVIDNTNPSAAARKNIFDILSSRKIPVRCFWFQTEPKLTRHLNVHRSLTKKIYRLPEVAFAAYESRFQEPRLPEGFSEIVKIPFKPRFDSEEDEAIFTMYLT